MHVSVYLLLNDSLLEMMEGVTVVSGGGGKWRHRIMVLYAAAGENKEHSLGG
jgi:hypothetical protein